MIGDRYGRDRGRRFITLYQLAQSLATIEQTGLRCSANAYSLLVNLQTVSLRRIAIPQRKLDCLPVATRPVTICGQDQIQGEFLADSSGERLAELPLPARAVRDGLIAAYGRLYVACVDGTVHCLGAN